MAPYPLVVNGLDAVEGHLFTVLPLFRRLARRPLPSEPWSTTVDDASLGSLRLTGRMHRSPGARAVLVIVHGLGGSAESGYAKRFARVAARNGISALRLNLRGADRLGGDYPHAGQTDDLRAAIASPALSELEEVFVVGVSLGGHAVLAFATEVVDARVRRVAAISAPLDLAACQRHVDARPVYRRYLLSGLKDVYTQVARTRSVPVPAAEARRLSTIRAWDDAIVAPRYGFADAGDYYARTSVAPRLASVRVPALIVNSAFDPLVPAEDADGVAGIERRLVRGGGHVAFRPGLDLGVDAPLGIEEQVVGWLSGGSPSR